MPLVTTAVARQHLRLADDFPSEMIDRILRAAEMHAVAYLDRKVFEDAAALEAAVEAGTAGRNPVVIDDAMRNGILMIAGWLLETPSAQSEAPGLGQYPTAAYALLFPYRQCLGV